MRTDMLLFFQQHLDRVSRSFAFCIQQLQSPLRDWVSLSYILCRQLDTIEDTPWESEQKKQEAFSSFERFLKQIPKANELNEWIKTFPQETPAPEQLLINDSIRIFEEFHKLKPEIKEILSSHITIMSRGMRHFSNINDDLRLSSLAEVNQYCFFVAGIVGKLLTDLFVSYKKGSFTATAEIYKNSYHFGLFLQKINLLKDRLADEKVNRFLVPEQDLVKESMRLNAIAAFSYIQSLPVNEKEYRLFCAWSLFLGLASIPVIEKSWIQKILEKLPRAITMSIFNEVSKLIDDNKKLEKLFYKLLPKQKKEIQLPVASTHSLPWLEKLCPSATPHLNDLGLLP